MRQILLVAPAGHPDPRQALAAPAPPVPPASYPKAPAGSGHATPPASGPR